MDKLSKTAVMTDIHFGARNNSPQHNQDNLEYLDWFCSNAVANKCDGIIFLGDWFEQRTALNISTLHYSYLGAKMLNDMNIPIYFIIGNHDLFNKNNRDIHSTIFFNEFSNFQVITEPTICPGIKTSPLLSPYLFHDEYPSLLQYQSTKVWFGHFEFKHFLVNQNIRMPTGPDPESFTGPRYIFSGHFHKRQRGGNIVYIGNTFPTSFNDANDFERGMMIFDFDSMEPEFLDWEDCPKFIRTKMSDVLNGASDLLVNSRVECLLDVELSYEEINTIKQSFITKYRLRDLIFKEDALSVVDDNVEEDAEQFESLDHMIVQMLTNLDAPKINNDILIEQYLKL